MSQLFARMQDMCFCKQDISNNFRRILKNVQRQARYVLGVKEPTNFCGKTVSGKIISRTSYSVSCTWHHQIHPPTPIRQRRWTIRRRWEYTVFEWKPFR